MINLNYECYHTLISLTKTFDSSDTNRHTNIAIHSLGIPKQCREQGRFSTSNLTDYSDKWTSWNPQRHPETQNSFNNVKMLFFFSLSHARDKSIARSEIQMRTGNEFLNFNLIKEWDPSYERSCKNSSLCQVWGRVLKIRKIRDFVWIWGTRFPN